MNPVLEKIGDSLRMVKFQHTVFALPFALIGMMLAQRAKEQSIFPSVVTCLIIIVACYAARTAAMTFNRIADRRLDALNPRTKNRELVTGKISIRSAWIFLLVHIALFILAAGLLNDPALRLSPVCLAVLLGYSYTKRFTFLSHFILGLALGLAPIGAWIAVAGTDVFQHPEPFLLGACVLLWTAGFDVIYACQDYEVDRKTGLYSIPRNFGIRNALIVSAAIHLLSWLGFILFWRYAGLGGFSLAGIIAIGGLLIYEHAIVKPTDLARVNLAFFNINGIISIGWFCCVLIDLLIA